MRQARTWSGWLPSVYVDGREYLVDFERQEFRDAGSSPDRGSPVDFESQEGQQVWDQLMILECPRCGLVTVESRYLSDVRCDGCNRLLAV